MTEQLLDVKRVVNLIWRHRQPAFVVVAIFLIVASVLAVARPPRYSASSLVLLPGSASSSTGPNGQTISNDMSTDSQIATSAVVLAPAGSKVDPSLSLGQLRQRVQADGTATNVLQITASGDTPRQAERLANAVASDLVKFVTTNGSATGESGLASLQSEAEQLTRQISTVDNEIQTTSRRTATERSSTPAGQADSALLASLTAQQSQSTLQLDNLNSQIAEAQLGASAVNAGTEVIQKATTASPPNFVGAVLSVLIGGIIGFALVSVLIVLRYRGDPRLRRRDQIAEAVGVPVVLSLSTTRRSKTSDWAEWLGHYEPSSNERWRVRKALREIGIGDGSPHTMLVLALAGDDAGLVAAPQLAVCAATLGVSVSMNVLGKDRYAMDLRAALKRTTASGHGPSIKNGVNRTGLTIMPTMVDALRPAVPTKHADSTILVVSAGFASAEDLARVANSAADSKQPVNSIVVTNPDPVDLTTGRFVL
ncbi:MAG: Wzz/FepE/Etk N-terminal domain-containing protein, partial [Acidimicrobiales bacterium]